MKELNRFKSRSQVTEDIELIDLGDFFTLRQYDEDAGVQEIFIPAHETHKFLKALADRMNS